MSPNKNPNVKEVGCLSNGFFAKVYRDAVQIFGPDGSLYAKLYKKTTENAEQKAADICKLLNRDLPDFTPTDKEDKYEKEIEKLKVQIHKRNLLMTSYLRTIENLIQVLQNITSAHK